MTRRSGPARRGPGLEEHERKLLGWYRDFAW